MLIMYLDDVKHVYKKPMETDKRNKNNNGKQRRRMKTEKETKNT